VYVLACVRVCMCVCVYMCACIITYTFQAVSCRSVALNCLPPQYGMMKGLLLPRNLQGDQMKRNASKCVYLEHTPRAQIDLTFTRMVRAHKQTHIVHGICSRASTRVASLVQFETA